MNSYLLNFLVAILIFESLLTRGCLLECKRLEDKKDDTRKKNKITRPIFIKDIYVCVGRISFQMYIEEMYTEELGSSPVIYWAGPFQKYIAAPVSAYLWAVSSNKQKLKLTSWDQANSQFMYQNLCITAFQDFWNLKCIENNKMYYFEFFFKKIFGFQKQISWKLHDLI